MTDTDTIKVTWGELADNGGDEVISYSLEIDDGMGGDFNPVVGYSTDYLLFFYTHEGVTRGTNYRLRYRAKNRIGWSEYSDIVYVLAATKPQKPPAPTLQSTDSTSITLNLLQTLDNGGSPIIRYKLYVDAGDNFNSEYSQISGYESF